MPGADLEARAVARLTRFGVFVMAAASACSSSSAREDELVAVLTRSDQALLQTRPQLVAGKYQHMTGDAYTFYRGTLALFRHDWEAGRLSQTRFELGEPVWGIGDPHPENFGLLVAGDRTAALEANDLDSADRVPALFDLRRLLAGLGVATRLTSPGTEVKGVAGAAARAYLDELDRLARGGAPARIDTDLGQVVLANLFKRSARDLAARAELANLTQVTAEGRRFLRGVVDPTDPTGVLAELDPLLRASVSALVARFGTVRDVVREYGSGVASWPRVRLLVLMVGPTGDGSDDFILEVKEEGESPVAGWYAPQVRAEDIASRVEAAARRSWARPDADPRYFTSAWVGFPVQVRTEAEANKGVKLKRLTGDRATPDALAALAQTLGTILARVHAASGPGTAARLRGAVADADAFVEEQAAFGDSGSASTLDDFATFQQLVAARGALLGFDPGPPAAPVTPELASLLETP